MDWLNIGIEIGVLLLAAALAWGKVGTKIALIFQRQEQTDKRIELIETNHLIHIESDLKEMNENLHLVKESIIRIEEHLKQPRV